MRNSTRWSGITRIVSVASLAIAGTALFAAPAQASTSLPTSHGVVFVETDNTAGNSVVVYDRASTGALHRVGSYATGGAGGILAGSVVDHTASQGSLVLDRRHGLLYAVNAGSNTITTFEVRGDHLIRRHVIASGGDFPVSVTTHGNLVYVLNARDGGSIQGYVRIGGALIRIPGWRRALGLDATATPEFTHTPGQIAFTPDGRQLVVTTKANGNDIDVYAVDALGAPSAHPAANLEDSDVPFAVSFDAHGHLVVAEAGPNALATFAIHHNGAVTAIDTAATGQAATCWVATDGTHFYASNAGSASVSGYTDHGNGSLTALGNTRTDAGTIDASATSDGSFLYVQTGGNGVVDGYRIHADGSLTAVGSVTVPDSTGGQGIATT
jgi:hypothetical protein